MLKYTGYIRKIRYYSESSHYIVALLEVEEDQELLTMNGYMSNFNDYDKYAFYANNLEDSFDYIRRKCTFFNQRR